MKKLKIYHLISKLWLLLLLSFSMPSFGQHTNDWIDYTKPYFKIKITAKGIYRINASTLTAVGLNFIDSENYQLFRNGVQVPIYINKTGSNVNYIEFYGFGNDGILDSMVFSNPNHQIQDKMSLFSSEAIYYLTFNNSGSNLRINDIANNLNNLPPKEAFFYYTVFNQYTAQYSYGKSHYLGGTPLYSALFEEGEGYMGNDNQQVNNTVSALNFNVSTPFVYTQNGADAYLKSSVVSWSSGAHHFKLKSGSTLINEFNFSGFKLVKSDDVISNSLLNTQTSITLEAVPTSSGTNRNNLAYLEIKYPRAYNFGATSFFQFEVQGNGNVQYLEIENFNNQSTQPILYDVTNGYRLVALDAPSSSVFRYALPASTNLRTLVLRANNASQYTLINALTESYFEDYTASNKEGNYIILSHPSLITSTELQNY